MNLERTTTVVAAGAILAILLHYTFMSQPDPPVFAARPEATLVAGGPGRASQANQGGQITDRAALAEYQTTLLDYTGAHSPSLPPFDIPHFATVAAYQAMHSVWGMPQVLETQYFRFTYYGHDARPVHAVAAELDALYKEMRHNLGLPSIPRTKISVAIVIQAASLSPGEPEWRTDHITVTSPSGLPAPELLDDAAVLRRSILLNLLENTIEEAANAHSIPPRWYPLLNAMRLWQFWDLTGPHTAWRETVAAWLHAEPGKVDRAASLVIPPTYWEMCALYDAWRAAPGHKGTALYCRQLDQSTGDAVEAWETMRRMDLFPLHSARPPFLMGYHDDDYAVRRLYSILIAALLDCIETTYGRDRIAMLWPALREHDGWEALLPAVLGISLDKAEAICHVYFGEMVALQE